MLVSYTQQLSSLTLTVLNKIKHRVILLSLTFSAFIYKNKNQTVNDGVAHSKNPRKFAYHVTFDPDLDLEHTLDARLPGDHRVQVWS